MVPAKSRPLPTPPQSSQAFPSGPRPDGKIRKRLQVPKFKPHTGTGKRVKVTGKGKLLTEQAGKRHLLEGKSSKVTRRMTGTVTVAKADTKRVKKLLGR